MRECRMWGRCRWGWRRGRWVERSRRNEAVFERKTRTSWQLFLRFPLLPFVRKQVEMPPLRRVFPDHVLVERHAQARAFWEGEVAIDHLRTAGRAGSRMFLG